MLYSWLIDPNSLDFSPVAQPEPWNPGTFWGCPEHFPALLRLNSPLKRGLPGFLGLLSFILFLRRQPNDLSSGTTSYHRYKPSPEPQLDSHIILYRMSIVFLLGTKLALQIFPFQTIFSSRDKLRKSRLRQWFSPGNLLEKQIIGSKPSSAESETLRVGPSNLF